MKDSAGRVIGRVEQQFSLCAADISLRVGSAVEYKVAGPCCVCDGPFCGDQVFHILDKRRAPPPARPPGPPARARRPPGPPARRPRGRPPGGRGLS